MNITRKQKENMVWKDQDKWLIQEVIEKTTVQFYDRNYNLNYKKMNEAIKEVILCDNVDKRVRESVGEVLMEHICDKYDEEEIMSVVRECEMGGCGEVGMWRWESYAKNC